MHRQWIVMNNEDRHRTEIRTVVDRMTKLLKSHADIFAGNDPAAAEAVQRIKRLTSAACEFTWVLE